MREYENWNNSRVEEMTDLRFAKPTDKFLYTRFTVDINKKIECKQVLYSEDIIEIVGYIRNIFLYDILNDLADDLKYDFNIEICEKQADIISVMNYWFKFGQLIKQNDEDKIYKLIKEFNYEFNNRESIEYEICILNGADELCNFFKCKHKSDKRFDRIKLENICSSDFFVGKILKDFIDNLFNT